MTITKMKKLMFAAVPLMFIAVIAIVPVLGHSQERGHRGFGPRGQHSPMGQHMAEALNLSDEQKAQMKELRKAEMEKMKPNREQMMAARKQLETETTSGKFNEEKVRAIASQISQVQTEMMVARARAQAKMFNLLTPEQKTKWTEMRQQREQRMQERKQRFQEHMRQKQQPEETK